MALLFYRRLAVQVWGEPRLTRDIDLGLMTGYGNEGAFIDTLLREYPPRLQEARAFALLHRTLLVQTVNGATLDISLAALPFDDTMISRAVVSRCPDESKPRGSRRNTRCHPARPRYAGKANRESWGFTSPLSPAYGRSIG